MTISRWTCAFVFSTMLANVSALAGAEPPLPVVVSIAPQKYFAEKVGGSHVSVTVMIPPGADPHTYEPKPKQVIALSRAKIFFTIGIQFEESWRSRFQSVNPRLVIVPCDAGITKIPLREPEELSTGHSEHAHEHGGTDPHIWLSPPLAKIIARSMHRALVAADPSHKNEYDANLRAFLDEADALDAYLKSIFRNAPRRKFIVFHPSWGYFAREYGLEQVAIEADGKEPKPAETAALIRFARKSDIRVIFVQPQFSKRSAETIAHGAGARLVVADPLAENWGANLRSAAAQFNTALR